MNKDNRYEFEGEVVEAPIFWDDHLQKEVEDYVDYCKQPGHTPSARPILLTIEDADPASVDFGSCRHYHQFPGSLLGGLPQGKNALRQRAIAPEQTRST